MKLLYSGLLLSLLFLKSAAPQGGAFWQRSGVDIFPHISYFDQYVNYRHSPERWGGSFTLDDVLSGVKDHFRMLKEAGFTHTVSSADEYSTDPSINPGLKIFDRHIDWSAWDPMEGSNHPGKYLTAQAQDGNLYPFKVAGNLPADLGPDGNFGFGNATHRSVWVNNPSQYLTPKWVTLPLTGSDKKINGELVRAAEPGDPSGWLLHAKINRMLFTSYEPLVFFLEAAGIRTSLPDTTTLLTVVIRSSTENEVRLSDGSVTYRPITDVSFTVRAGDIKGTGFKNLKFEDIALDFSRARIQENQIEVGIYYHGKAPVAIRSFYFAGKNWLELTGNKATQIELIRTITAKLEKYKDHPLFEAFYCDEPYLLSAATRKLYTEIIRSIKPKAPNRSPELSAVTGGFWLWHLMFDRKYSSVKENSKEFYRNFLLFDYYPLKWTVKRGWQDQSDLQRALNNMIEFKGERLLPFDGKEDQYQFIGYLQTIMAAQNMTPADITDDIPLFQTIQVSGARQIKRTGNTYTYNENPMNFRVPTRHEIFAMCNLALAYGAKGLMYYMVPTRIDPIPTAGETGYNFATYGIFDDASNIYDENDPKVSRQRAGAPQVPNRRYYAIQEYIHDLEKFDKKILKLHWVNAYSADRASHRVSDRDLWIRSVSTTDGDGIADAVPYVEVGLFQQLNASRDGIAPDSVWLFVVNRLCDLSGENSSEGNRTVTISLNNGFAGGFDKYDLIDHTSGTGQLISSNNGDNKNDPFRFSIDINSGRAALILLKRK